MTRRDFLKRLASWLMGIGLATSFSAFLLNAFRFVMPTSQEERWSFVVPINQVKLGTVVHYKSPRGMPIDILRQGDKGKASDFIALSKVCPHLGCLVHWQEANDRFFCPCHNGVFNPEGVAISGPPAQDNLSLKRYPLKIKNGLLYIDTSKTV